MQKSFWNTSRALVGGGCGFLGSYIVPELVRAGAQVTIVDNLDNGFIENLDLVKKEVEFIEADLRDPSVCDLMARGKDIVLNLAAKAFGMEYSRAHNGEMLIYNLLCTLNLIEAARKHEVERLLVVSSSCVYPDDAPVPTPELDIFTGLPERVNEGYGWAKRIQELAGYYCALDYGMKITIVRPFNPYGANYRWRAKEKAHIIPLLVKRIMDGEDPLVVWGSGKQRRNFLHASDAAKLIMLVMEKDVVAVPINIGYDDDISIAELINLICEVTGRSPKIIFDESKPEGRFRKCADVARLRKITNDYHPQVTLRDGIEEMMEWYKKWFGSKKAQ
jgi:nucleoside-diphosphate-sugar epimerase